MMFRSLFPSLHARCLRPRVTALARASSRRALTTATRLQYVSFYNYTPIAEDHLPRLRRELLNAWSELRVLGRIYIATEGINAQLILPARNLEAFATAVPGLYSREQLNLGATYEAVEANDVFVVDGVELFEKLDIRIRRQIEHPDEPSLFKGKNFVFDQRCVAGAVGGAGAESEVLTEDVLGTCFQCGEPCNDHTNCSNLMCHGLILQCKNCASQFLGACSEPCREQVVKMNAMTPEAARAYRKENAARWRAANPNAVAPADIKYIKFRPVSPERAQASE
ncbi:hypothetical protein P43SY_008836 [Pythium insidiosum]|uniref:Rhodanese domain-containing protein n=1 Tax=Pythium insidiosum TaxID=114742 RepID=A0AAD5LR13_PYTIN|nr:hypothetical protein P43SY_008836 [Pythium insidiosum]